MEAIGASTNINFILKGKGTGTLRVEAFSMKHDDYTASDAAAIAPCERWQSYQGRDLHRPCTIGWIL